MCKDWYDVITDPKTLLEHLVREGCIDSGCDLTQLKFQSPFQWIKLFCGNLLKNPNLSVDEMSWHVLGVYRRKQFDVFDQNSSDPGMIKKVKRSQLTKVPTNTISTKRDQFTRSQEIDLLSRIPKMTELFQKFDVYLKWSAWVYLAFSGEPEHVFHEDPYYSCQFSVGEYTSTIKTKQYGVSKINFVQSDYKYFYWHGHKDIYNKWDFKTKLLKLTPTRSSIITFYEKIYDLKAKILNPKIKLVLRGKTKKRKRVSGN